MFASCNAHNAHEEPNTESMQAIAEGDAFLASGQEGRFSNAESLIARLSADFSTAFSRDLKKKAQKRQWDLPSSRRSSNW